MAWEFACLLCEDWESADLVLTQEHTMAHHGVTREQIAHAHQVSLEPRYLVWRLPDGRLWMRALALDEVA